MTQNSCSALQLHSALLVPDYKASNCKCICHKILADHAKKDRSGNEQKYPWMEILYRLQFNGFRTMESIHISFQILDTCFILWNKEKDRNAIKVPFRLVSSFQNLVLGIYPPYLCLNWDKWLLEKEKSTGNGRLLSSKGKFW